MTRLVKTHRPDRPSQRRSRQLLAVCTAAALIAAACSSDDGAVAEIEAADPPPAVDTITESSGGAGLAAIELATTTADPFDRVSVTGLDGLPTDELALWMLAAGDVEVFVPVYLDAEGAAEMVVPFHPDDPIGGGDVEMYFGDGTGANGPTIEFAIGPMAPVEGAWNEFLEGFRVEIDRAAGEVGSSVVELAATDFDDVPAQLLPLKLALAYLDDGTDNSLVGVYDSDVLTDDDRELLDALTAQIDLAASLRAGDTPMGVRRPGASSPPVASPPVASAPVASAPVASPPVASPPVASPHAVTTHAPSTARPLQSDGGCLSSNITVANAADLSDKLTKALDAEIVEGGPEQKVLQDIGTVMTVGSFIPGVGWVAGVAGTLFSGIEAQRNGVAGMYPSRITSLDASIDIVDFQEDFVLNGQWFGVIVVAESTGWRAAADVGRTVLSGVSTGLSGGLGSAIDLSVAQGLALDSSLLLRDNAAVEFLEESSPTVLTFCPQQWTVDITGEPWSRASSVLGRFDTDDTSMNYWPSDTGGNAPFEDILRIEVDFRRFRNQMVSMDFPVGVRSIQVSGPTEIEVDNPGDLVDVEFTVSHAHDITLKLDADEGGWVGGEPTYSGGDPLTQRYTHISASDEAVFPYVIFASSASTSGLRANGDPPRVHTVRVRLRELIVRPDPGSVRAGDQVQFTATDRNGNPVEVTWSATGGTIDAEGRYTAGDDPGTFSVSAVDVSNSRRTTTVAFIIEETEEGPEVDRCILGLWTLDNASYAAVFSQVTGLPASVSGLATLYFDNQGATDNSTFFGELHQGFTTTFGTGRGQATFTLDSADAGQFTTVMNDGVSGSGVLAVGQLINLFEGGSLAAGDATVIFEEGRATAILPEITVMGPIDPEPADGWEQPRAYTCTDRELLFPSGSSVIRYTRVR